MKLESYTIMYLKKCRSLSRICDGGHRKNSKLTRMISKSNHSTKIAVLCVEVMLAFKYEVRPHNKNHTLLHIIFLIFQLEMESTSQKDSTPIGDT